MVAVNMGLSLNDASFLHRAFRAESRRSGVWVDPWKQIGEPQTRRDTLLVMKGSYEYIIVRATLSGPPLPLRLESHFGQKHVPGVTLSRNIEPF